jgi:hypothetical protein
VIHTLVKHFTINCFLTPLTPPPNGPLFFEPALLLEVGSLFSQLQISSVTLGPLAEVPETLLDADILRAHFAGRLLGVFYKAAGTGRKLQVPR